MGTAAACRRIGKSIRGSGALREELAASLRLGIAPRRFQGWEPRTVTDYVHDDDGKVIQTVEYREPEYDDEQRAWLLAYLRLESDTGPHGESIAEATSAKADPNYYGAGSIRYVTHGPITNHAVKSYQDAVETYKKNAGENANFSGMYWTVEKQVY